MPYNVQIHNYNNHADDRSERAPLTVAGTTYTDGTFSTITLDSTLVNNNQQQQSVQHSNTAASRTSSPFHLFLFLSVATIEGLIQFHYGVWWAAGMNALIITTGMATLLAGQTSKNIHLVTLWVWGLSAAVGLILFSNFVVLRGQDYIPGWCLEYANERYSDHDITIGVCATLENDGTFEKIWLGAVVLGVLLGFPFMFYAVLTVYRFYADAARR